MSAAAIISIFLLGTLLGVACCYWTLRAAVLQERRRLRGLTEGQLRFKPRTIQFRMGDQEEASELAALLTDIQNTDTLVDFAMIWEAEYDPDEIEYSNYRFRLLMRPRYGREES